MTENYIDDDITQLMVEVIDSESEETIALIALYYDPYYDHVKDGINVQLILFSPEDIAEMYDDEEECDGDCDNCELFDDVEEDDIDDIDHEGTYHFEF